MKDTNSEWADWTTPRSVPIVSKPPAAEADDHNIVEEPVIPQSGFPTESLPEPLRSMVHHAARQTSTPEALCAAAGLGTISAAIGAACRVQSGQGRETPANLFLLPFAESGTGKGQAVAVMTAPLDAAVRELMEAWRMEERPRLIAEMEAANADLDRGRKDLRAASGTAEGAAAADVVRLAVKRRDEAEAALARSPMINIGNATAEAIVESLSNAPGEAGAIISAEARDVVANLMGRYSKDGRGSDEPIYLQSYSGDMVVHSRKGKAPLILSAPCLAICLAAQPDIWEKMSGEPRLMESGFLARCMIFDAKAKASRPSSHRIPDDVKNQWADTIHMLVGVRQQGEQPAIVIPSKEAQTVLDDLANYAADMRDDGGDWTWCRSFAARLAENAWRLALVFHAIQHPQDAASHPLPDATAAAAVTVARWFFAETLALLSPIRSKQNAARMDKLVDIFHDKATDALPIWRLEQKHGFKEAELRTLATEFPHRLRIVAGNPGPRGGRPSTTAELIRTNRS